MKMYRSEYLDDTTSHHIVWIDYWNNEKNALDATKASPDRFENIGPFSIPQNLKKMAHDDFHKTILVQSNIYKIIRFLTDFYSRLAARWTRRA